MPKRSPDERWQQYVLELYEAFRAAKEFKELRRKGLQALGLKRLLTAAEWPEASRRFAQSEEYLAFVANCREVGARFGLNDGTVRLACLVRGYRPENAGLVIEAQWPEARVVTEVADPVFLAWLCCAASQLGLRVVQRQGPTESTLLVPWARAAEPEEPLTDAHRPPVHKAFRLRVETPSHYPPEAAADLHRRAQQAAREVLRRLGYRMPERLRPSELTSKAKELRVGKRKLERRETGDIAEDLDGEGASLDPRRRKLVKSRRHRVKKRLERHGKD